MAKQKQEGQGSAQTEQDGVGQDNFQKKFKQDKADGGAKLSSAN